MKTVLAVLLVSVCILGTGCGTPKAERGAGSTPPASVPDFGVPDSDFVDMTGKPTVEISVLDNTFDPAFVTVSPGTTLIFRNDGRNTHNVVPVVTGTMGEIATEDLAPGRKASIDAPQSGDAPYFCSIHGTKKLNGQSGIVRVG